MKRIISFLLCIVMVCSIFAVNVSAGENYYDKFDSEIMKLWWSVAYSGEDDIYEFSPKHIKWYTLYKINIYDYDSYEIEKEYSYGSDIYTYTITYYQIPADVFEAQALKHFNISDINTLRNDKDHEPCYNAETNTYDMPDAGGFGDSVTYVTKGYKDLGNGKYEVYGYTVEQAYDKPDDAVEGVDYIIKPDSDYPVEILESLRITVEYNENDVKFLSWEKITVSEVPAYSDLIFSCAHISSAWITDKKATVNKAGKKHKECTKCGEVLETATIKQLKCSKPKLKEIENTEDGIKITWGKVSGADKYYVYRKVKGGSYSKIGTTTKTSYTDKKAKSGKKYYYYVKAVNEAGSSDSSKSLSKLYLSDPTMKTPKSTKKGVTLNWSKVTGAQGYVIYYKTGSGSYKKLTTVKGNSKVKYTHTKAKKGKTYTYKVKAYYSKTTSAYSNAKKIKDKY